MKKITKLLSAVAVFMIAFSVSAFALTEGDWEFQLLDNEIKITAYNGTDTEVVIPSTIYGAPVTKVSIDTWNHNGFKNVTSLEYPGTVKEIRDNGVGENLKEITLHEGTEIISSGAFRETGISLINLPSTIKEISDHAFYNSKSLSQINFHSGIKKIGESAFKNTALTQLDLTSLPGDCIFDGEFIFSECKSLKTAKLPEGMTVIPTGFLKGCESLNSADIPNSVQTIGISAFAECTSLENIILPTSLQSVEMAGFAGCTSLKEVVIPYGTKTLSHNCFYNCPSLKSLYIPDTVNDIATYKNIVENSDNCIIYCSAGSYAEQICKREEMSYLTDNSVNSGITVLYNGTRISFHSYGQNPELLNSRTLVPLRSIFEAMGAEVEWDGDTKTAVATRNGVTVKIQIGANEMYKGNEKIAVDVPATILNDRTMVPARVIAEAFGADVQWNANGKTVLINE